MHKADIMCAVSQDRVGNMDQGLSPCVVMEWPLILVLNPSLPTQIDMLK